MPSTSLVVSFSFSAVARIAVPPGKWFCLARTGLGYDQYSCCVCKKHGESFRKYWAQNANQPNWQDRIELSINQSLRELEYDANPMGFDSMSRRMMDFLTSRSSYIVNPVFEDLMRQKNPLFRCKILTDAPSCLVSLVFPQMSAIDVVLNKSTLAKEQLECISNIHIGSSEKDLIIPQNKAIISKKGLLATSHVPVYPDLTEEVFNTISSLHTSINSG